MTNGLNGKEIVSALNEKFDVTTDLDLATALGISTGTIQNWRSKPVSVGAIARLVTAARRAGANELRESAVRPVVEFFPIEECDSKLLFSVQKNGVENLYKAGLRDELKRHHGVYVFFDSRGQAIYARKARTQTLWAEMNKAFNRDHRQSIRRVEHPTQNVPYLTNDE